MKPSNENAIWQDISKVNIENVTEDRGVYWIKLTKHNGTPRTIYRFLGIDKDGTLEIGCSINLRKRLMNFKKAFDGSKTKHSEGHRLYLIKNERGSLFKQFKLQFKCIYVNDYKRKEAELLQDYFVKYGELPVLNNNCPNLIY